MVFDISKLEAKSETINIMDQDIIINPMTMPKLIEFMKIADRNDIHGATKFLTFAALRDNIPTKETDAVNGMDDNELNEFIVNKLNSKALLRIVTAVRRVSGISEDKEEKNEIGDVQSTQVA